MSLPVVVIQHRNEGIVTKRAKKNLSDNKKCWQECQTAKLSYIAVRV